MKKMYLLAAVVGLLVTNAVSFYVGFKASENQNVKDYQVACIMSDCCRNMVDNIGLEAEEIYYEYADNLDCFKDIVVTQKDLEQYSWDW